eukprot:CAMPEP_0183343854 /NCGR_PEP_ID=MMETSP0164_2-20130417/9669_1 /TAXON_ID=221442 /ORGANISM="Coccolithus pelagicus ssp braarudi, Strain PLY182g" /LENGTH=541 /DNA_ID=CAMNT_0025514759 /DNA_START=54 /DNA_END=1679 /DNA_ORIENTATION=+
MFFILPFATSALILPMNPYHGRVHAPVRTCTTVCVRAVPLRCSLAAQEVPWAASRRSVGIVSRALAYLVRRLIIPTALALSLMSPFSSATHAASSIAIDAPAPAPICRSLVNKARELRRQAQAAACNLGTSRLGMRANEVDGLLTYAFATTAILSGAIGMDAQHRSRSRSTKLSGELEALYQQLDHSREKLSTLHHEQTIREAAEHSAEVAQTLEARLVQAKADQRAQLAAAHKEQVQLQERALLKEEELSRAEAQMHSLREAREAMVEEARKSDEARERRHVESLAELNTAAALELAAMSDKVEEALRSVHAAEAARHAALQEAGTLEAQLAFAEEEAIIAEQEVGVKASSQMRKVSSLSLRPSLAKRHVHEPEEQVHSLTEPDVLGNPWRAAVARTAVELPSDENTGEAGSTLPLDTSVTASVAAPASVAVPTMQMMRLAARGLPSSVSPARLLLEFPTAIQVEVIVKTATSERRGVTLIFPVGQIPKERRSSTLGCTLELVMQSMKPSVDEKRMLWTRQAARPRAVATPPIEASAMVR